VIVVMSRRAVDPIKDGGDFQDLAPGLKKVAIQDRQRIASV
jgi:hypothetical protein